MNSVVIGLYRFQFSGSGCRCHSAGALAARGQRSIAAYAALNLIWYYQHTQELGLAEDHRLSIHARGRGILGGLPEIRERSPSLALNEMLLESHEGVLRLFPCWPKDQDARFGTLRACGAFLVSAELKGGSIGGVKIASEKG
jgi:hypothetical protein